MQIKEVGLREGVFVRRYKMTRDYGKNERFSAEILKNFIKEVMEPDYLLVQDAYDRGMHKEEDISRKTEDYKIGLIAANHPGFSESMTITNEELQKFYERKKVQYNIDLVVANSFSMADSLYRYLKAGNTFEPPEQKTDVPVFPQYRHHKDITYGDVFHLDIFPELIEMKEGQISEPVYTTPYWTIIILNKVRKNKDLKSFDKEKTRIVQEHHALFKHRRNKQLLNELRDKYKVSIHTEYYPKLISSYNSHTGIVERNPDKRNSSDLQDTFLTISDHDVSLSRFISIFNRSQQLTQLSALTREDLSHFVDKYINQYVLYLDALEKGVENDELIKDKLVNKEFRLLLAKYLKEQIASKVMITDEDARKYYADNRDKWAGAYENVEKTVKFELRDQQLHEIRNALLDDLRKKYDVRYNEPLLEELAEVLTEEKAAKARTSTIR